MSSINKVSNIKLINVDSTFRTSGTNTDFKFTFPTQDNVVKIRLASVELPNMESVFTNARGNNKFKIKIYKPDMNDIDFSVFTDVDRDIYKENLENMFNTLIKPQTYTFILPDGNYTAVGIIQHLNVEFQDNIRSHCGANVICELTRNGKLSFIYKGFYDINTDAEYVAHQNITNPFKMDIEFQESGSIYPSLGNYLGFNNIEYESSDCYIIAEKTINVMGQHYAFLKLTIHPRGESLEPIIHSYNKKDHLCAFAKIIIREEQFSVTFDDGSSLLSQAYTPQNPIQINNISVKLVDAYNNDLSIGGLDFSFTLELTTSDYRQIRF